MLNDFKAFMKKENVIDMAVGIIIGIAFGAIIASFVNDVLMPPIGLAIGNVDFANLTIVLKQGSPAGPYTSIAQAQAAGAVTLNYGLFINTIINFIIIAAVVFFLIVRPVIRMKAKQVAATAAAEAIAPTTKTCPHCFTSISIKATRCPNCTSTITN